MDKRLNCLIALAAVVGTSALGPTVYAATEVEASPVTKIVNATTGAGAAVTVNIQTAAELEEKIKNQIQSLGINNDSTESGILDDILFCTVSNSDLKLRIDNFVLTPSTTTKLGSATGTIVIIDSANSNVETTVPIDIEIPLIQTAASLEEEIKDNIQYLDINNDTTENDILDDILFFAVSNSDLKLRMDTFALIPSTTTKVGSATGTIVIIDSSNSNAETTVPFDIEIPLIQTAASLEEEIKDNIQYLDINNDTTESDILDDILFFAVSNSDLKLRMDTFALIPSTTTKVGSATGTIVIIDSSNSNAETTVPFDIEIPLIQTAASLEEEIKDNIQYLDINNDTTESDILDDILFFAVSNSDLKLRIDNFALTPSTTTKVGSATGTIVIIDSSNSNAETTVPFDIKIPLIQTAASLEEEIKDNIQYLDINNDSTESDILDGILFFAVSNSDLKLRIDNFVLTPSTTTKVGSATGTIVIIDSANSNAETTVPIDIEIPLIQTAASLEEEIKDNIQYLDINNDTTESDILDGIQFFAVSNSDLKLRIDNFVLTPSTTTKVGSATGTIVIIDSANSNAETTVPFTITIDKLTTEGEESDAELENAKDIVSNYLSDYSASNSITKSEVLTRIKEKLANSNITVTINNFNLKASTRSTKGLLEFTVVLTYNDESTSINYSDDINKKSSSSGSSSSSSNSSSSSSTSSSNSKTSTTSISTTSSTSKAITADTIKSILTSSGTSVATKDSIATAIAAIGINNITAVDTETAKAMTNEIAKVVTENVASNLSIVVGKDVIARKATDVTTTDGNKLEVTTITTKDSKFQGAVITAEKASSIVTIPVDAATGEVKAVYKFIPLLGKYIELTEGVTIGANTVTLPTQANAVYYAATKQMAATETITQGWAKINNNWYMVNNTGDPQTGWQKDSTGAWTYLSPDNGIMQTGWSKQGDTWYHLKPNGYMSTGWLKDNDGKWYYLNSDGSMAHDIVIDGYTVGSNGAWI